MKLPLLNPSRSFSKFAGKMLLAGCFLAIASVEPVSGAGPAEKSAHSSLDYLRQVMDQFHNRFPVYDDVSSAGNHFQAYGKFPENAAVDINGSWTASTHSGSTAIRCVFVDVPGGNFGGFYFQNGTLMPGESAPRPNFGTVPLAGINLTGVTALTFWAQGANGGERIEFFVAGVGRNSASGAREMPYPDSSPRQPAIGTITTLSASWQKYTIDLTGLDLSYVLGGFAWVANDFYNPGGAVFYLDDIQYELSPPALDLRLNEPRFLRSFSTLPLQPDPFDVAKDGDIDFVLRNIAFAYDNALALLAFLADGSSDSLRRAKLIGDAFVRAAQHDRTYNDNRTCDDARLVDAVNGARIRSAYAAGDIALPPGWYPNGRAGTVPIPGFYSELSKTFYEVEQEGIDTGNNAWVMIALMALHHRTNDPAYLEMACKIGRFIRSFRNDTGKFRGFLGGIGMPEDPNRSARPWASSEHNLDINAAFTRMFEFTGDSQWRDNAEHAREFVEAMWDPTRGCFLAGTTDPSNRNAMLGQLPVDVQAWSILALSNALTLHPEILRSVETQHRNTADGFTGFDFNDDRDGVWFEGSAQMAVAYAFAGESSSAENVRRELRRAQSTADLGDGNGLPASSHDGLSTGFSTGGGDPFKYFRRLHVGATAWNVFGQLGFNPYYQTFPAISDARLAALTPGAETLSMPLSPAFASAATSYTARVSHTTTSITVTPTVAVTGATVMVNGTNVPSGVASGAIALNVGANTISVMVTAHDGITTRTYTLTVTRSPDYHVTAIYYRNYYTSVGNAGLAGFYYYYYEGLAIQADFQAQGEDMVGLGYFYLYLGSALHALYSSFGYLASAYYNLFNYYAVGLNYIYLGSGDSASAASFYTQYSGLATYYYSYFARLGYR